VEESQAGNDVYSSGMQYENPVSCIVAGRGLVTCCGVGVDHIPSPTASVFIDISFGFIVTAGNERGG
tara:strand:+ start:594 stop:794 length:201 start_codon:yes stop_codon:yes gene_type:complete